VLDLHRFIAGLSLAFLTVHVGALLLDSYVGFSPAAITIPFVSHWRPAAVAWGILAFYLLVAIEVTSLLMAHLPRRVWHAIHLGSFVVFAAATVHGLTAGTDAHNPALRLFAIVSIAAVVEVTVLRVVARARRRSRVGEPAVARPTPRFEAAAVEPGLAPPTLRPIEDAIAEVRRGAARGGRVARPGNHRGRLSRGARR
jgi:DMSO/TMAO reductase YedYZ heme-binding membrane subunit